jgi:hypothetical protein
MKKYQISMFTTNLLAIVLAVFFIQAYESRDIPITNVLIAVLLILAVFLLISTFILKPRGKIKRIFPKIHLLALNLGASLIFSLIFIKQIWLGGFLFVMAFTFLLSEAEHMIYEVFGK